MIRLRDADAGILGDYGDDMRLGLSVSTSPGASGRGMIAAALVVGVTLLSAVLGAEEIEVKATVETEPVPAAGDCADDLCIWAHPTDPALSVVIGTAKTGRTPGLHVYDISGKEIQHVPCGRVNNVDVRYNFPLGGKRVDLVAATNRSYDSIALFTVDPRTRRLVDVAGGKIRTVKSNYGFCMYRSARTGRYYGFVVSYGGKVEQWRLFDNGGGKVDGKLVRRFDVGSISEGCVADDELGHFYVSEERKAIWKYGAEPGDGDKRTMVDGARGHFKPDVEGLTIYYARGGTGYLIASSQGSSAFVVYKREGKNDYVKTFRIVQGRGVDAVGGIDVANVPLGPAFPKGVFVAQDNSNPGANQNFKLVPWESIAQTGSPVLTIDTTWDPRKVGPSR